MPSAYLQGADLAVYGVSSATSQQITQASSIIDGYLQRPEGLLWAADGNGNPCYMQYANPSYTLMSSGSISPGQNVNVTVTGAYQICQPGFVLILDRGNSHITEACIINAVTVNSPPTSAVIQLTNVMFSHGSNCTMEGGLVIFEECQMPDSRPLTNVSRTPVINVIAGQGRYGYPRRGNASAEINEYNLLAAITKFGGPPVWEIFDQTLVGVDPNSGLLWAPAGILLAYYTEIRFSYVAGWQYSNLPPSIKQACANIINASAALPINGAIKSYRAGDTAVERFAATYLDDDTKTLLEPFQSRQFV